MGEVQGQGHIVQVQGHIVDQISTQCTSFSFHNMNFKKHIQNFENNICQKSFHQNFYLIITRGIVLPSFVVSGSHFIGQTIFFLLKGSTAST